MITGLYCCNSGDRKLWWVCFFLYRYCKCIGRDWWKFVLSLQISHKISKLLNTFRNEGTNTGWDRKGQHLIAELRTRTMGDDATAGHCFLVCARRQWFKRIHSHVFISWLHPVAILGTVGMNGPLWTVVRNALSVGFSNASPFFLGGTEYCCGGRMVRTRTHVPARSCVITPSWRETADAALLPARVGVSSGTGTWVWVFVSHLESVAWSLNYTKTLKIQWTHAAFLIT